MGARKLGESNASGPGCPPSAGLAVLWVAVGAVESELVSGDKFPDLQGNYREVARDRESRISQMLEFRPYPGSSSLRLITGNLCATSRNSSGLVEPRPAYNHDTVDHVEEFDEQVWFELEGGLKTLAEATERALAFPPPRGPRALGDPGLSRPRTRVRRS
jgi:hypothetical protein